jgi:signal transduction histidine kinase/ActR/RegA family two-component response regulator
MDTNVNLLLFDSNSDKLNELVEIIKILPVKLVKAENINNVLKLASEQEFALGIIHSEHEHDSIFNLITKIKANSINRFLPFILLTNKEIKEEYLLKSIASGIVDFVKKPVSAHILLGKVNVFLELYQQRKKLENEIEQRKATETKMVVIQNNLKLAKDKAEEADKLKSAFLANMSHEIRTPMNAIVGFSNLLIDEQINPAQRHQYTKYINSSSNSLMRLIDDIIDIAKIEAGQLKITASNIHVQPIMRELLRIHTEEISRRRKSKLVLKIKLPDKDCTILSDELRVKQVLTNLLNNAIKFTIEGEIEFGYHIIKNQEIRFFVKDTGIGIPPAKLDKVFDRFQRIDNHDLPDASGTGLGLSIAKRIVELLGGNIQVESSEGFGSTFSFTLPYNYALDKNAIIHEPAASQEEVYTWADKLILVAEDEFINFQFLKETLRPTGVKIIWAKNGLEAVKLCNENKDEINTILMDIKMPVMSGYEATIRIKQDTPEIPIVAQTAYAMSGEKENCMEAGFDEYLSKPIKPADLYKTVSLMFKLQEEKRIKMRV